MPVRVNERHTSFLFIVCLSWRKKGIETSFHVTAGRFQNKSNKVWVVDIFNLLKNFGHSLIISLSRSNIICPGKKCLCVCKEIWKNTSCTATATCPCAYENVYEWQIIIFAQWKIGLNSCKKLWCSEKDNVFALKCQIRIRAQFGRTLHLNVTKRA